MLKVVNETRLLIRIFAMRHQGHEEEELKRIHRQHCELVRAVAERNSDRAASIVSEHIQTSRQERLDAYDQWERETSLRAILPSFFDVQIPAKPQKQQR